MMRLEAGDRLGPFEIVSILGAGGMGEVYRARDPRIGRDVAIKILRGELGRFEQEVRAVGALNHPNILAIYDVGEHAGTPYLVSELLDGKTLRAHLDEGALKLRVALDCALGMARGLAAAHQKGVAHRDLKPENIFLTRDGRVKILDFGLAKLILPFSAESASTLTAGTSPGAVMGTVGYMSPEQVRGAPADCRTDLFSFGVTLHEMLAGGRAFQRDSAVETTNAILKEEAPDLPPGTPPLLRRIVARCLEKDPERRFQSAADLAFALESCEPAGTPAAAQTRPPSRRRVLAVPAVVAVAGGAFYLGTRFGRAPQPAFHRLTFRRGMVHGARFVPGSREIVYDAAWEGQPPRIFSARFDSPESRTLEIPPARLLALSRTGELAVKLESGSALARVPLGGGSPREVLRHILWADWSPDGTSFMVARQVGSRHRIEFPIGKVVYETDNEVDSVRLSPDGRHIAFFEERPGSWTDISLNLIDLQGGKRTLSAHWNHKLGLVWTPDGKEIWFSSSDGSDAPSIRAANLRGEVRSVFRMTVAAGIADVGADGRVLFAGWTWRGAMMCQPPGADRPRDLSWLDYSISSDISADGSTVLFTESKEAPLVTNRRSLVYIRKTDGSPAVSVSEGRSLGLSPDGQWAAVVNPASPRRLLLVPTGAGEQRVLTAERFTYYDARWFPDGKRLLVWGNQDGRLRRHFVQAAAGGGLQPVTAEGSFAEAAISPDGEFVAAYSGPGVFLFPLDGTEPQPVRGDTAGARPVAWSEDAGSLYLRRGTVVELVDLKTGKSEVWKDVTPPDPGGVTGIENLAITPDSRAYVYSYGRYQSDLYLLTGLREPDGYS